MKKNQFLKAVVFIGVISLLTACAGPNTVMNIPPPEGDVAGFWSGLWNGVTAPVTFLISLFDNSVSMYEVHNNGRLYDLGFVLGVISLHIMANYE